MKKVISILLSVVMLLSITAGMSTGAYAHEEEQTYIESTSIGVGEQKRLNIRVDMGSQYDGWVSPDSIIGYELLFTPDKSDYYTISVTGGIFSLSVEDSDHTAVVPIGDAYYLTVDQPYYILFSGDNDGIEEFYQNAEMLLEEDPDQDLFYNVRYIMEIDGLDCPYWYGIVDGGVAITAYVGRGVTDLTIPSTFRGYDVVGIGLEAFAFTDAQSITVPDSVTSIGFAAFMNATNMSTITIMNDDCVLAEEYDENGMKYKVGDTLNVADIVPSLGYATVDEVPQEMMDVLDPDHDGKIPFETVPSTATIRANDGSKAQEYAEKYGVPFDSIHTHIYDDGVITPATCVAEGSIVRTCTICGKTETSMLPVSDEHTIVIDAAVAPTCTKPGLTEGKHCSECEKVIVPQTVINNTGHTWNQGRVTKAATCTSAGVRTYTCACGATKTGSIPAKGHKEVVDKAVPATYAKAGKTEGKHCSTCGKVIVAQKSVPKLTVPKITLNAPKSAKSKQITVSWNKNSKVTGYQIQIATNSKFTKGKKTYTIAKNGTTSKKISKLKGKQKYYVRIRGYKTVDGKRYYSAWSKAKTVTTKK